MTAGVLLRVGDTVTLGNTFEVDGTATDPTTVTLAVTAPDGTATSYTLAAAEITKTDTGVYEKDVTADQEGTWAYTWTGTGTAADVASGTFTVRGVADVDSLNVLSYGEALDAINMSGDADGHADEIAIWVTALSRRIDARCGPVVRRDVTDTVDGTDNLIPVSTPPIATITSVTEYVSGTGTVLTAETVSTAGGYLVELDKWLRRRSSWSDINWQGRVEVVYSAGRAATTADVDPLFKLAAGAAVRRLWAREAGAWARGGNPFAEAEGGSVGFFRVVDPVINEFLAHKLLSPGIA